jgi:hypothetical protein
MHQQLLGCKVEEKYIWKLKKKKIKLSRYRPGQALGVPGG